MAKHHIAQINVGEVLYPTSDPRMAEFMQALDQINALADNDPGFVWRLQDESGNSTDVRSEHHPDLLVNMSVWSDLDALYRYVYRSAHAGFVGQRKSWFVPATQAIQALWWIEPGHIPQVDEGLDRLETLRTHGPGPRAFSFKQRFTPQGAALQAPDELTPSRTR